MLRPLWAAARRRPLATLAAGFVAGIALYRAVGAWPAFLFVTLAAALLLFRFRHALGILLLGLGLGGLRQAVQLPPKVPYREVVEGVVAGPPKVYRTLEDPDAGPLADGSFVIDDVQVRYFRKPVSLIGGERVRVRGPFRRPRRATNPGEFDYGEYLERNDIYAVMTLVELEVLEGPPAWSRARAWFRRQFDRHLPPDVGAFLSAIVLGRREAVPDELVTHLQRSGTAHLLAISGQNLFIVMISVWAVLVVLGLRPRAQTFLLLLVLGLYTLLTGLQVSVVRSFLMMAAFFGADLAWRKRDALSSLGAAALAICLYDPRQVADVGFQLSFAAVLGLALVAPVFHAFSGTGGFLWNRLRMGLGVSTAAWLSTAPIVLSNFNLLTPGIVLANLFLVPLITLLFIAGLAHLVLAPLGAGFLSGAAATGLFEAVRFVSSAVTSLPLSYLYAPSVGPILVALYYAALAGWTLWCRRAPERGWRPLATVALAALLGLGPLKHRTPEGVLLAVLDVGRGSCAYVEWPDGRNLMVDCGSLNYRDAGSSVAAKYLWSRGVTRLDTLVLTHPDADHVNGAHSVIEFFRVRRVVVTRAFARPPPGAEAVVVERRGPPERLGDLEILGPPLWEKFGRAVAVNETSIVLRTAGILFPGDIEEKGTEELLTLADVRARVLILPHHGKYFENHAELVRRVAPELALVSAPEGYYSEDVVASIPVPVLITGRAGAIELELRSGEIVRRLPR